MFFQSKQKRITRLAKNIFFRHIVSLLIFFCYICNKIANNEHRVRFGWLSLHQNFEDYANEQECINKVQVLRQAVV